VVLATRDALGYLAEVFEVPVPAEVLGQLRAAPTTRRDAVVYRLLTRRRPVPGRLGGLPITLSRFVCLTAHDRLPTVATELPAYLARSWHIERPAQAPRRLADKVTRVARGR
jgi:hypothetical protein